MDKICHIGEEEKSILKDAINHLSLSARAYNKIFKVARTIADLICKRKSKKALTGSNTISELRQKFIRYVTLHY